MKQILRLTLNNFGPAKDLTVEFSQLSSIRGQNSTGKTFSIFNALECALLNEEFPEQYINHNAKFASIKVEFTDGSYIFRERIGNKQSLTLGDKDNIFFQSKDKVSDCGDIVRKFTQFDVVKFDGKTPESLQFVPIDAAQTYLISGLSPENVLKRISTIMCGGELEQVLQKLISRMLSNTKEYNLRVQDLKQLQEAADKQFNTLPYAQYVMEKLDKATEEVQKVRQEQEVLNTLINTFNELAGIDELHENLDAVQSYLVDLDEFQQTLAGYSANFSYLNTLIQRDCNTTSLDSIEDSLSTVEQYFDQLNCIKEKVEDATNNLRSLEIWINNSRKSLEQLEYLEIEKIEIQKEIDEYQEKQPVCEKCGRILE
ncbi:MAG TPA: AAA family ATPase [Aquella sp.]|nr:AAA family ATPase [Aquella sp.]